MTEESDAQSRRALGLLRRSLRRKRLDAADGRRPVEDLRNLRKQLRRLDETWRSRPSRPQSSLSARTRRNPARPGIRTTTTILVPPLVLPGRFHGSAPARRRARRVSDDLQRRPGLQRDHAGECRAGQHARRHIRRRQQRQRVSGSDEIAVACSRAVRFQADAAGSAYGSNASRSTIRSRTCESVRSEPDALGDAEHQLRT